MTVKVVSIAAMAIALFASNARAQVDVGVTAAGLLSIQPVDDWYGGSPYLDEGIGGMTFGFSGGFDAEWPNGFVVVGEVSTVLPFEQHQIGRLVDINRTIFGYGESDTRMRDTLISGLAGVALFESRLRILGGVSLLHTTFTEDGRPLADFDFEGDSTHRTLALTGGADFHAPLSPRVALVVSGRYSLIDRAELAHDLGAGRHVIRAAVGVRITVN